VDAVVVDVSDNGGGVGWVGGVERLLSSVPLTCPALAELRDTATAKRTEDQLRSLHACGSLPLDAVTRDALSDQEAWLQGIKDDAAHPCDLSGLFRGEPRPNCSLLTRARAHPCDALPLPTGAGPGAIPAGCTAFRRPTDAAPGAVSVPVFILINRGTASASEELASVLRDAGAATLIGERTLGAGCGHIDNGGHFTLSRTGLKVSAPNCARFRKDGTNELEGVAPDIVVPWSGDDVARYESYAEKVLANADAILPLR
jgi:hypothetical protein